MKPVKFINLKGETYDTTFEGNITIETIRRKLLSDYNYNTERCYFCRSGKILDNISLSKETFTPETQNNPIVIFNSLQYPDKSYPKVDNAFNLLFSRYSDNYTNTNSLSSRILGDDDHNGSYISSVHRILDLIEQGLISPEEASQFGINISYNPDQTRSSQSLHLSNSESEEEEELQPNNTNPYHHSPFYAPIAINSWDADPNDEIPSNQILFNLRPPGFGPIPEDEMIFNNDFVLEPPENDLTFEEPDDQQINDDENEAENNIMNNENAMNMMNMFFDAINGNDIQGGMQVIQQMADENPNPEVANQLQDLIQNLQEFQFDINQNPLNQQQLQNDQSQQNDQNQPNQQNLQPNEQQQGNQNQGTNQPQENNQNQQTNQNDQNLQDQQQIQNVQNQLNQQNNQDQQQQQQQNQNNRRPPPPTPANNRRLFSFQRNQDNLNQQIIESLNLNINLNETDNQAISRLAQVGYDRALVIQVYAACDKNEEEAMNVLLSMG